MKTIYTYQANRKVWAMTGYQCKYCPRIGKFKKTLEKHEKECTRNPKNKISSQSDK